MKIELKFVAEEMESEISASGDSLSKAILDFLQKLELMFQVSDSRIYATLAKIAERHEDYDSKGEENQFTEFSRDFSCPEDNFSITLIEH